MNVSPARKVGYLFRHQTMPEEIARFLQLALRNVRSLRTSWTINNVKPHALAFFKGFEPIDLDGTEVDKHVSSTFS